VEWLGDVPEHWEVKRLKSIASIRYGLGQPPRECETGLPLVRMEAIDFIRTSGRPMSVVVDS
jgi:type I restriction enzyme S subunit